jgi:hypothetical protein
MITPCSSENIKFNTYIVVRIIFVGVLRSSAVCDDDLKKLRTKGIKKEHGEMNENEVPSGLDNRHSNQESSSVEHAIPCRVLELKTEIVPGFRMFMVPLDPSESPEKSQRALEELDKLLADFIREPHGAIKSSSVSRSSRSPSPTRSRRLNKEMGMRVGALPEGRTSKSRPPTRLNNNFLKNGRSLVHQHASRGFQKVECLSLIRVVSLLAEILAGGGITIVNG